MPAVTSTSTRVNPRFVFKGRLQQKGGAGETLRRGQAEIKGSRDKGAKGARAALYPQVGRDKTSPGNFGNTFTFTLAGTAFIVHPTFDNYI
jgi:hypothetical protein